MTASMHVLIQAMESLFAAIPLALLEVWGRLATIVGALLSLLAYGGFTLTRNGHWGLGRIRQSWNARALLCAAITFAAIPLAGWLGSSIVLVEGAQTFESLKDVVVFLAVVLFGYPALLVAPVAYMLSDLIEGNPPAFVFDWFFGYFFWIAFVWLGAQLIGRNPDFRKARVWLYYAAFVLVLMAFDPVMWGYLCSKQFTPAISYTTVSSALAFTLSITWIAAPLLMLGALPLARRYGLFWAEIPGYVSERRLGAQLEDPTPRGMPLRAVLAGSFVALALLLVGSVAYVSLQGGRQAADRLAIQLHAEAASKLNLQLDAYLGTTMQAPLQERLRGVQKVLSESSIAGTGRVYMVDRGGKVLASSEPAERDGGVIDAGLTALGEHDPALTSIQAPRSFRFDVVSAKPLARESWLAQVTPYSDNAKQVDWLVIAAMPESRYLAGAQAGSRRTAVLCTLALTAALALSALLASLLQAFNRMAAQLHELNELLQRTRASETTAKSIFEASPVAMAVFDIRNVDLDNVDADRKPALLYTNRAWERVTGHSPDFTKGKTSMELGLWADPEDRQRMASKVFRDGSVQGFPARLLRADGAPFEANISIHQADVGEVTLAIFAVEDVTVEREAHAQLHLLNKRLLSTQAELMDLNTSLDLRVRERTRDVEKSVAELQAALNDLRRTQDQLVQSEKLAGLGTIVARVAHEMNTPLGIAVTASSTLQDHVRGMQSKVLEGKLRRTDLDLFMSNLSSGLGMVMSGLDRAHRLVTTFKQVASDHNNEDRRRFDLYQCIDATHTLLETALRRTPYQLAIDIPPGIEMDSYPGAIEQVFINLFNNALLHAFEGRDSGQLSFSAEIKGQHITLVFEDDGIGMSDAVRRRIFDPFFTTKAGSGGSGLGLSICFNLVTSTLGGEMSVDSREGDGTRFVIRVPLVAPPPQSRRSADAA